MLKELPIILDYDNFKVKWNDIEIDVFGRFSTSPKIQYGLISEMVLGKDPKMKYTNPKGLYQEFTQSYQITPSKALQVIDKLRWKVLCEGWSSKQIFKYCYPRGIKRKLSPDRVKSLRGNETKIKQALSDRQECLVPLILRLGMSAKEIKDSISKSCWKQLLKNSYTKNYYLSTQVFRPTEKSGLRIEDQFKKIETLCNVSSSILQIPYIDAEDYSVANRIAKEMRVLTKRVELERIVNIVSDTRDAALQLGERVNDKWSWKRWNEEHEHFKKRILAKDFSSQSITLGLYPKLRKTFNLDGFTIDLLDNPMSVALEGSKMRHCVASYAKRCAKGTYVVYHITSPSEEKTTLGCNIIGVGLQLQQHYGVCNMRASEESKKVVAKFLSNKFYLNEEE